MKKIRLPKFRKKEKEEKEKKVIWKTLLSWILVLAIIFVSLLLVFSLYIVITSPNFEKQELYQTEPSILYDINGNEKRVILKYDDLPEVLIDALIATEDSRFF